MTNGLGFRSFYGAGCSLALLFVTGCAGQASSSLGRGEGSSAGGLDRVECRADGDIQFVCGPEDPEDLAWIPGSPWVIVASYRADGYLSAADSETRETFEIYPSGAAPPRHDAELFPDCPNEMRAQFYGHGVYLSRGTGGIHTLYAVRHQGRETIEVFEVDARGRRPVLTWVGCLFAPYATPGFFFNSVVELPDRGIAVTSPGQNSVWEWQPDAGWHLVPGSVSTAPAASGIDMPNGIEVSPDGEWYYIGAWGGERVVRLSRGRDPVVRETLPVGFRIDNVHWAADGDLLVAGHAATAQQVGACLGSMICEGYDSKVWKVSPDLRTHEEIFNYPASPNMPLGTTAIQVGNEFWIGGLRGTRIAVVPAR